MDVPDWKVSQDYLPDLARKERKGNLEQTVFQVKYKHTFASVFASVCFPI